jgi:predicted aconitase with swiveling domain
MLDPKTGIIKDPAHELYGKSLKSKVLIFPNAVGSSVGAYVLYSLKMHGSAPSAIICTNGIDIITASACAISEIPAVVTAGRQAESVSRIKSGIQLLVDADNAILILTKQINL